MARNYLEQLLEKIEDAEARVQFNGIASKVPQINEWIVDPDTRQRADDFAQWAESNWDEEHSMPRNEYAQSLQIQELEGRLAATGEKQGMELSELDAHLGKFITEKGLVTRESFDSAIKAKEDAFNAELNLVSTLATRIPYLNAKYNKDFGEMFEPDEFVRQATDKGYARYGKEGLDKFYDEYTAEKRTAKANADIEARIEAARKEERTRALQERAMGAEGQMPTFDDGSPQIGHLQARLSGEKGTAASAVPADAVLGRGQISRIAARLGDQAELTGRVQ